MMLSRKYLTVLMNSTSLDPRSLNIASLVDMETPRGPGVNNFFSCVKT